MAPPVDVLVVDDEEKTALAVVEALACSERCEPRYVLGVPEAFVAIRLRRPDVVVADLVVGALCGTELLSRLRVEHPQVVRILYTSSTNEDLQVLVDDETAHAVVTKTPDHESLLKIFRSLTASSEASRCSSSDRRQAAGRA